MDAAAAEVDVDDRADIRAVKAGDQGVEDVDVGGIAGGVDTHGVLGAAAHLDELTLALGGDAALAAGLLDELAALQGINVAGGLGVNEVEDGVVVHLGVLVHLAGLFPGLLSGVAAQNGVQAGHAGLQRLLAQLIDAVAAADNAGHLAGIGGGQAHYLAVLVQVGHLHVEAVGIGADGLDVFLDDLFCSLLRVFHYHITLFPDFRFSCNLNSMAPALPHLWAGPVGYDITPRFPARPGHGGSGRRTPGSCARSQTGG